MPLLLGSLLANLSHFSVGDLIILHSASSLEPFASQSSHSLTSPSPARRFFLFSILFLLFLRVFGRREPNLMVQWRASGQPQRAQ